MFRLLPIHRKHIDPQIEIPLSVYKVNNKIRFSKKKNAFPPIETHPAPMEQKNACIRHDAGFSGSKRSSTMVQSDQNKNLTPSRSVSDNGFSVRDVRSRVCVRL